MGYTIFLTCTLQAYETINVRIVYICVILVVESKKTDVKAIDNTIKANKEGLNDVLFLGGEPCLYLAELIECVEIIKQNTDLKSYVTTSAPKVCKDKQDLFFKSIDLLDSIHLSVQDYKEDIGDEIRRIKSKYDTNNKYGVVYEDGSLQKGWI